MVLAILLFRWQTNPQKAIPFYDLYDSFCTLYQTLKEDSNEVARCKTIDYFMGIIDFMEHIGLIQFKLAKKSKWSRSSNKDRHHDIILKHNLIQSSSQYSLVKLLDQDPILTTWLADRVKVNNHSFIVYISIHFFSLTTR